MGSRLGTVHVQFPVEPALRSVDLKRAFVQQGSSFGHGWECGRNTQILVKEEAEKSCKI